ncbi:MAG: alpha-1,2-fucosyltransferase [Solirubrobacterales bacterium]
MKIARLSGGLGNQLFQYACLRALSARTDDELFLDASYLRCDRLRSFALAPYRLDAQILDRRWLCGATFAGQNADSALAAVVNRSRVLREAHFQFDPRVAAVSDSRRLYLIGYWQSERYFGDIADELRAELQLPLKGELRKIAESIQSTESVSIHVRRGDLISRPKFAKLHGSLTLDYYNRAAALIADHVSNPRFFIFSDDPEWCRENLKLPGESVTVSGPAVSEHADMALMSVCDHNVIANSTFSWWGAWLGDPDGRTVIAPNDWFAGVNHDTSDLIPERWTRI